MSYDNQKEKVTLQVVPHTEEKVFSLKLSRKFIKFGIYFFIIALVALASILYYYYYQFNSARREIRFLVPFKQQVDKLKQKNNYLQSKLSNLSEETEQIKTQFNQIKEENHQIKEMIDFNDEISSNTNKSSNQANNESLPQATTASTGNSYGLVIENTKSNLSMLDRGIHRKKKDLSNLKQNIVKYKDYLASKPKGWPILHNKGRVTSKYGYRFHPVLKKRVFHDGIDIGVWYNHKVIATGKGKVVFAGSKSGYGRAVIIDHSYGYRTLYGHNGKLLVRTGERVKRGEVIALSGNSGRSTGPHLHYEVLVNGHHTNPKKFF